MAPDPDLTDEENIFATIVTIPTSLAFTIKTHEINIKYSTMSTLNN
jgi:hypothetical protein